MDGIHVIFVWINGNPDVPIRRHAILPALPAVGHLVKPPGDPEEKARNVRAIEWDCSEGNGSRSTVHVLLDN